MNRKLNQLLGAEPPTRPSFTEKQGQYLAFSRAYRTLNGQSPSERDLQRFFGVTPPSVHQRGLTLERADVIRREPGIARCIELLIDDDRLPRLQPHQSVKTSVQRD